MSTRTSNKLRHHYGADIKRADRKERSVALPEKRLVDIYRINPAIILLATDILVRPFTPVFNASLDEGRLPAE